MYYYLLLEELHRLDTSICRPRLEWINDFHQTGLLGPGQDGILADESIDSGDVEDVDGRRGLGGHYVGSDMSKPFQIEPDQRSSCMGRLNCFVHQLILFSFQQWTRMTGRRQSTGWRRWRRRMMMRAMRVRMSRMNALPLAVWSRLSAERPSKRFLHGIQSKRADGRARYGIPV